jgi:hypothetical protein
VCILCGKHGPYPEAKNDPLADVLTIGMVDNNTVKFVTSGNAVLRFKVTKYLSRSEILLINIFMVKASSKLLQDIQQ